MFTTDSASHRIMSLLLRIIAAVFGGYALAVTVAILLGRILTHSNGEAALAAMLMSFACFMVVPLWVFHQKSIGKIYIGLIAAIALTGSLAWFLVV